MSAVDPFALIARVISAQRSPGRPTRIASYAALGDSFTAGTGCETGEAWADRIAAGLERSSGGLTYRNLAAHGATSGEVRAQLGPALQLEPDLVTVICGANDLLPGGRLDAHAYSRNLGAILGGLRRALPGVRIVTATAPERWDFLPVGPRTRSRLEDGIERMNRITRSHASSHGAVLLDVARHPGLGDASNFAADGLHPSPLGHARMARGVAGVLGDRFGLELDPAALR